MFRKNKKRIENRHEHDGLVTMVCGKATYELAVEMREQMDDIKTLISDEQKQLAILKDMIKKLEA